MCEVFHEVGRGLASRPRFSRADSGVRVAKRWPSGLNPKPDMVFCFAWMVSHHPMREKEQTPGDFFQPGELISSSRRRCRRR